MKERLKDGEGMEVIGLPHPSRLSEEFAEYASVGEVAYSRRKFDEALEGIRKAPGTFAELTIARMAQFWLGPVILPGGMRAMVSSDVSGWVEDLYRLPIFALMLVGVIGLTQSHRAGKLLLGTIIAFPLIYYITHTTPRYRLPVEPVILVFAGYGFLMVIGWWLGRNWSRSEVRGPGAST